ncbi:MAG: choice-of-anchor tandem repeat GloVer-containing protein [Candidatus Sulfotelmatobacter sp.]
MRKLGLGNVVCVVALFCVATALASPAQTYTTLVTLDGTDGEAPGWAPLVQGLDGNFYGVTLLGGTGSATFVCNSCGTVFKVTPSGELTTLYNFCSQSGCSDGARPAAGLTLGINGNFYGTTLTGGAFDSGTIFEITPTGTLTTLYAFCSRANCPEGGDPLGGVIQGLNGTLYGTTSTEGPRGAGTVFKLSRTGEFSTLFSFCPQTDCPGGQAPMGPLTWAANGNLVGTTAYGGTGNAGTIFEISPAGHFRVLHAFAAADDSQGNIANGVVLARDGNYYGTTYVGGTFGYGSIFELSPLGRYATLFSFSAVEGDEPEGTLVQGFDGNFYGTTYMGGPSFYGNIFRFTPSGTFTSLYDFCSGPGCPDGQNPSAGLVQGVNGIFYGGTGGGGSQACIGGCGTIYSLSVGLSPLSEATGFGRLNAKASHSGE